MSKKTCYYELLGLDRKCDATDIKSNYRKLALKMHPDKASMNNLTVEEATRRFQQIQEAYSCLSDPQERAWYDAHREQILRGDDEPGEDPFKTKINLYAYFGAGCFDGFGPGPGGFYAVYADLFASIDNEEEEWEDADEDHVAMPPFGGPDSEWSDVAAFYRHWLEFCSRKAFGHADKWNPKDAPNRQVRRAMEGENKKARKQAKSDFNGEVRHIVEIVKKRDPRVQQHQKQQMKENAEKAQAERVMKEQKQKDAVKERQERQLAAREAEEARWREVEADKAARRVRGEIVSEDESSDESAVAVGWTCEPCKKSFKSEKAFDQHTKSKKHLQIVAKLRKELARELKEETDAPAAPAPKKAAPKKLRPGEGAKDSSESQSDSEDSDEDEDDALARLAAVKQQRGQRSGEAEFEPPPRGRNHPASSSSSDAGGEAAAEEAEESSEAEAVLDLGGSKKAQKRAKQKALLLEKKKEREKVQELVSSVRKAQRAGAEGEKAEDNDHPLCPPCQRNDEAEDSAQLRAQLGTMQQSVLRKRALDLGLPSDEVEEAYDADDPKAALIELLVAAKAPLSSSAPTSAPKSTPAKAKGKAAPKAGGATPASADPRCAVCGEEFPSRSKMFQHIRETGHAALKEAPPEPASGGRRKKR